MTEKSAGLWNRLEAALRRLLESSGTDIDKSWAGDDESQWNRLDALETMAYAPPSFWLNAAAQHYLETAESCNIVAEDLATLFTAASAGEQFPEDSLGVFWALDDLEFHLFTSHLHSYLVRDQVAFRKHSPDVLVPEAQEYSECTSLNPQGLARVLEAQLDLPSEKAASVAQELADLAAQCQRTIIAIEEFGSEPDADYRVLGRRFGNVQRAMAELVLVLLRADASAYLLSDLS